MNEIVEYKPIEAAIADLQRFKGLVVDVNTPEGLAEGKAVARQAAAVRIALDKARKKLKEKVLEDGRQIDGQAKPLFARVAEIEDPITAQLEAKSKAEEREREAKIQAEKDRIEAEQRAKRETEEAELRAARALLAKQQEEMNKARLEQERIAREARLKIELDERAARAKIEEAERQAREARAKADADAKRLRDAEELHIKQERDKIEAERRRAEDAARALRDAEEAAKRKAQAEADAKAKAIRDAAEAKDKAEREEKEAKEREIFLAKQELSDGRTILINFRQRFGKNEEFDGVCAAIDKYLAASGNGGAHRESTGETGMPTSQSAARHL